MRPLDASGRALPVLHPQRRPHPDHMHGGRLTGRLAALAGLAQWRWRGPESEVLTFDQVHPSAVGSGFSTRNQYQTDQGPLC